MVGVLDPHKSVATLQVSLHKYKDIKLRFFALIICKQVT